MTKSFLATIAIIMLLIAGFISWHYAIDVVQVREVKKDIAELESFYAAHDRYPLPGEFQERYSGKGYSYSTSETSPRWYSLEYPMKARRSFAVGSPVREMFGFAHRYFVNSCTLANRCHTWLLQDYGKAYGGVGSEDVMFVPGVGEINPPLEHFLGSGILAIRYFPDERGNFISIPVYSYYAGAGYARFLNNVQFDAAFFTRRYRETRDNPANLAPGATPNTYQYVDLHPIGKLGKTTIRYHVDCTQMRSNCESTVTLPIEIY